MTTDKDMLQEAIKATLVRRAESIADPATVVPATFSAAASSLE